MIAPATGASSSDALAEPPKGVSRMQQPPGTRAFQKRQAVAALAVLGLLAVAHTARSAPSPATPPWRMADRPSESTGVASGSVARTGFGRLVPGDPRLSAFSTGTGRAPVEVQAGDGEWSLFSPVLGPPSRYGHSAIYDPIRDRVIVFGGNAALQLVTLQLSDPSAGWQALDVGGTTAPGNLYWHTAVYDPVRDRMVVFGGAGGTLFNDVWALALDGPLPIWTRLNPSGALPAVRQEHAAIYDPVRDRMLVIGGYTWESCLNDVWELSFEREEWTQLLPTGAPPAERGGAVAVYDGTRDRVVLFGGGECWNDGDADVWALDLAGVTSWTSIVPTGGGPAPRRHALGAYDTAGDRLVVHGGAGSSYVRFDDVWSLSFATGAWEMLSPTGDTPQPHGNAAAAHDATGRRLIVYGDGDGAASDTWALSLAEAPPVGTTLVPASTGGFPSPRRGVAAVLDGARQRLIAFGGREPDYACGSFYGYTNYCPSVDSATWIFSLRDSTWSRLPSGAGGPAARTEHSMIYDAPRDRLLVFGGYTTSCVYQCSHHQLDCYWSCSYPPLNDAYALSLSDLQWSVLAPEGMPPGPRYGHAAVYDPVRDRMIVLGGEGPEGLIDETWALLLGGASPRWAELDPAGEAPGRLYNQTAVYDASRDRVLVFGGEHEADGDEEVSNALWELSFTTSSEGTWARVTPDGSLPAGRHEHVATYDALHDHMLVHGGWDEQGQALDETWALDLARTPPRWLELSPAGVPPAGRAEATAAYDETGHRMLLFAGLGASHYNDLWTLSVPDSVTFHPDLQAVSPAAVVPDTAVRLTLKGPDLNVDDVIWLSSRRQPRILASAARRLSDIRIEATFDLASVIAPDTLTIGFGNGEGDSLTSAVRVVVPPAVVIRSPNGGRLASGAMTTLAWSLLPGTTPVDRVVLDLSTDGGRTFAIPIDTIAAPDSTLLWSVPYSSTDSAAVRALILDLDGIGGVDTSDGLFGIGPDLDLTAVTPSRSQANTHPVLTLTGSGFAGGATVWLSAPGRGPIYGTAVNVDAITRTILATFDLTAAAGGLWTVTVRNVGGAQDSLPGAFEVVEPPDLTVLSPNGGEALTAGTTYTLRWRVIPTSRSVDHAELQFSTDDGPSYSEIANVSGTDSAYAWTVPYTSSSVVRFRVLAVDVIGTQALDESDAPFSISSPPGLHAVAPAKLAVGGTSTLRLYGGGFGEDATVWLSADEQTPVYALSVSRLADTELEVVFDLTGTGPGVRTVVLAQTGGQRDSLVDAVRLIAPPRVTLSHPNGGERFASASGATAAWAATVGSEPIERFELHLSTAGASAYSLVATAGPADTSAAWSTPSLTSYDCRIRVIAVDTAGIIGADESDAAFSISPAASGPVIHSVTPGVGTVGQTVALGLRGENFTLLNVWLERGSIRRYAEALQLTGPESIACTVSLASMAPGAYDVVEQNNDTQIARLPFAFTVYGAPDLAWVEPEVVGVGRDAAVTLHGTSLTADGTAWLSGRNRAPVFATRLELVSPTEVRAFFPLDGVPVGTRTVVLQTPTGSRDSLPNVLSLVDPPRLTVDAPNGGEIFTPGTSVTVRWALTIGTTDVEHVDVLYSTDGGETYPGAVAQGLSPDRTSVEWLVPAIATDAGRIQVIGYDFDGVPGWDASDGDFTIDEGTSSGGSGAGGATGAPSTFALGPVSPQPARDRVTVTLALPRRVHVRAEVFDSRGLRVARIFDGEAPTGRMPLVWDGRRTDGGPAPAGIYVCRASAGTWSGESRIVLLR